MIQMAVCGCCVCPSVFSRVSPVRARARVFAGAELPVGTVGNICVRGGALMPGYESNEEVRRVVAVCAVVWRYTVEGCGEM
jgi:acyl-CoA synthetase (AMP-forming)/AMP-acid ligase II